MTSFFLAKESLLLLEIAFFQNGFLEGRYTLFGDLVNNCLHDLVGFLVTILNDDLFRLPLDLIVAVLVL
jgi:hypothetical protein